MLGKWMENLWAYRFFVVVSVAVGSVSAVGFTGARGARAALSDRAPSPTTSEPHAMQAVNSDSVSMGTRGRNPHVKAATSGGGWGSRCHAKGVVRCLSLKSEVEIARFRTVPKHLGRRARIQYDPAMQAARFTVPSNSAADTSGSLHIPFPFPMSDVYVAFDVYYPADFLAARFRKSNGWKMFILGQGSQGCSPYEVVGVNLYWRGYPNFYYLCGRYLQVAVRNPYGDNSSEYDYQPGGDTQCLRHGISGLSGCARFVPNQWLTYQIHVIAEAKWLEVWQTARGKTLKIVDFPLNELPDSIITYGWIKLTPYQTGKDATVSHPEYNLWYRHILISSDRIPDPSANDKAADIGNDMQAIRESGSH